MGTVNGIKIPEFINIIFFTWNLDVISRTTATVAPDHMQRVDRHELEAGPSVDVYRTWAISNHIYIHCRHDSGRS